MSHNKNIAIFASGGGSNFKAIYNNIKKGMIPAKISLLITDNSKCGAVEFARENNIETIFYKNKSDIDPVVLKENGLIRSSLKPVKVLGKGDIDKKMNVSATSFSESAKNKIEKAGGKVTIL